MSATTPTGAASGRTAAAPGAPFLVMLRGALLPAVIAAVAIVVVLGITRGASAALSATLGTLVVIGFFGSGLVLMAKLLRQASAMLFVAVAMSVYLGQVIVLLLVMVAVRQADWLDSTAFGIAVLTTVLVWQATAMRAWRRARTPVYDEGQR